MEDWRLRDTVGVLIVLGVTLSAAATLEGVAQGLVILVGVVIVLLWIGRFFLEGYTDSIKTTNNNS
ncbi:hypothetical protein [Natrialba chahannaoensis]|uniref:hypothetical protein n=1 Tax=Natrialba chahannaoensis TaxID=68911 RepID=UPI001267EFD0|nr:hypothetical protein [Natrialba chahannaoensis]